MEKMASLMEALRQHKRPARRGSMHSHHQPFPAVENHAAPCPSNLWADQLKAPPYPTNAPWQNFVLNKGTCHENLHPFLVQAQEESLSICYPPRAATPGFIFSPFIADLTFRVAEGCGPGGHVVSRYDDLSVTLLYAGKFGVPLVRGSPYVTICVDEGTPVFSTIHAVVGFWANCERTKHRITLNSGQTWVVYSSHPLPLTCELRSESEFQGVIRITVVSGCEEGEDDESLLDKYRSCYPIGGTVEFYENFEVVYKWETLGPGDLLMLTLPQHREIMSKCYGRSLPALTFKSLDGTLEGIVGHKWGLSVRSMQLRWHSTTGIHDPKARAQVAEALETDVRELAPISTPSTYFHGKALARAARMALIAEELHLFNLVGKVVEFLQKSLTPWFLGQFPGNQLMYDTTWGGIISRDGSRDPGADFGLGVYNDHHFHLGYFVYAGAVLARLDHYWAHNFKPHVYALIHDYMSVERHDFPRLRNFDCYKLHSWASGLTEFTDGRNQESTSEAVNAYYAAALAGLAYNDFDLVTLATTLCALENRTSQLLWHVPVNSTLYDPEFVEANRIVSIVWSTKRDSGLWFAGADRRDCRLGIQVLPITPITEDMFPDKHYVEELVEWTMASINNEGVTDAWRGFVYALKAIYNPTAALEGAMSLKGHDDGNSYSNLLWWIHTRKAHSPHT
ncbi:hypothetical protein M758_12G025700 [Ceratodon purpureus]|nr:hypothetical protein M758_12G025700 [Ceratodon purpureus]